MAAYVIGELFSVTDPSGFEEYRRRVPTTIEHYGGRFIARRGRLEPLDGDWNPKGLVVIEFPSMEHARRWYESAEYLELKTLRLRSAKISLVLTEGVNRG